MAVIPHVVDDQLIETGWGNAVADAAVNVFATVAERDSLFPATVGRNGMMCRTVADSRVWMVIAGVWRLVAGSMPRVLLRRSVPVSVPNTTNFQIPWDTEAYDADGLHAAGAVPTIVIPAALAGRWRFDYAIGWEANATGTRAGWIDSTSIRYASMELATLAGSGVPLGGSVEVVAAAAQTFSVYAYQTSGVGINVATNATSHYFGAQYVGPA